tara:strand:+ start:390 stop:851 length:462 start_codon:yes stop_codon:yes gene_type:complete
MSIDSVKKELSQIAPDLKIIEHKSSTATVDEAAIIHNVENGQIVKTMALMLDKPIILIVSGDRIIDNKKYKSFFKKKVKMLSKQETEIYTSHPIGGVCPFGLPSKMAIYADISLNLYENVYPAAGSKNSSILINSKRLIELISATMVDVTKLK